ncbi:MAG: hypothetical protein IPG06_22390 [Haliea sp.]|nr:hypothetical protein [Haliea sp.]
MYVSDEEGWFYAIDAKTGVNNWKVKTQAAAGAAAVGTDGTISTHCRRARRPW